MTADAKTMTWETASVDETRSLGQTLGRLLAGGLTIGLVGPLGAGKTQLVKGIAVGNGLADADQVTSPTFTLVNEYDGRLNVYHLDAYRLGDPREFISLGFEEFISSDAVVVVEWADRVTSVMPEDSVWIELIPTGETGRRFAFRATGERSASFLAAFAARRR